MSRSPSPVIFYKAALCPRCLLVKKVLARLRLTYPELVVVEIDAVRSPLLVWQGGIRMIPALKTDNELLSGILLTPATIERFVARHLGRSTAIPP
jgi:predicted DsbA family dithiol-disulfide isomerase